MATSALSPTQLHQPQFGASEDFSKKSQLSCRQQQQQRCQSDGDGDCSYYSKEAASCGKATHKANIDQTNVYPDAELASLEAAVVAVYKMDIPLELAQLAFESCLLDNADRSCPPTATDVYKSACFLNRHPSRKEGLQDRLQALRGTLQQAEKRERQHLNTTPSNADLPAEVSEDAVATEAEGSQNTKPEQENPEKTTLAKADLQTTKSDKENLQEQILPKTEPQKAQLKMEDLKKRVQRLARLNRKLRKRKLCRKCQQTELSTSGTTFLPCGHFITCEQCAETFDDCPSCGKSIMGTVRTFLA